MDITKEIFNKYKILLIIVPLSILVFYSIGFSIRAKFGLPPYIFSFTDVFILFMFIPTVCILTILVKFLYEKPTILH